jgi:hypothetical protein
MLGLLQQTVRFQAFEATSPRCHDPACATRPGNRQNDPPPLRVGDG